MLAIEVTFLSGRYSAADFRDRDKPEWPPHPSRLFSAMVAGFHETRLGESVRAALLWLESLPPPALHARPATSAEMPTTVFVPINDPTGPPLPERAERRPRGFPSVVPAVTCPDEIPSVFFIWPEAQPDEALKKNLDAIAETVAYLGNSRSPVRVRIRNEHPAPNWLPDESGDLLLRVPNQGRLENLERSFQAGLRPSSGAFQNYRKGEISNEEGALPSVFGEMVAYRLDGPVGMEIETTLKLTEILRAAAMKRAQEVINAVPEVLSGHDTHGKPTLNAHAAYVAFPFVSGTQRHADGRILGVGVVLPRQILANERRLVIRALMKLDHLNIAGIARFNLHRLTPGEPAPYNLRDTTWAGPSRCWSSVTPVVLDRFPKKGRGSVADILSQSCKNVGLPEPTEIVVDRHSALHGVEPSFRYPTKRRGPIARLHTHVTLSFAHPVRGPILIGAGRHFGLGLMRPLQGDVAQ